MKNNIADNFFNSTVKPSDFRFRWTIVRWKDVNHDKVMEDLEKLGMLDDFRKVIDGKIRMNSKRANEIKAKWNELRDKHMSKHYTYCLRRISDDIDAICNKMKSVFGKHFYKKVIRTPNYSIMKQKSIFEEKKTRKFSSLSAMQKWVDKNGIKLDVYKLWEKSSKEYSKIA